MLFEKHFYTKDLLGLVGNYEPFRLLPWIHLNGERYEGHGHFLSEVSTLCVYSKNRILSERKNSKRGRILRSIDWLI